MSNRLFFNAREWSFNKACQKNVGERCFINGIDGKMVEVYTIGNWEWDWTEIVTKPMMLELNTEYSFSFWLNGGENDRNCEVCQFRVVFDDEPEDCLIFKLNRGYIKPLKRYKGWELYDIPFFTGDHNLTQLKFVAQSAYMAIQPAKEPEAYEGLEDVLDEFDEMRPQRHNIVFEDGWPANNWYSTKELRKKKEGHAGNEGRWNFGPQFGAKFGPEFGAKFGPQFGTKFGPKFGAKIGQVFGSKFGANPDTDDKNIEPEGDFTHFVEDMKKRVRDNIMQEIDMDEIVDEITEDIDVDDIMEDVKKQIDIDSLREEIRKEILKRI